MTSYVALFEEDWRGEGGKKKKLQITVKTYSRLFTSYVTLFKFEEDWTGEGGGEELKELGGLMVMEPFEGSARPL